MESNTQVPILSTFSRPLANFHPSVWGDRFLHLHESNHNHAIEREQGQVTEKLKEEVKRMLVESNDYVEQVEIVDAIQRLGIAYHFQEEIDEALQNVVEKFDEHCKNSMDLHVVALSFRLLRQHGYRVSSEVFAKFTEDAKGDWIVPKTDAVKGMLELYEATHLRVHNEDVLDSGFVFSRDYLSSVLPRLHSPYDEKVRYSLERNSYRRGLPRMEARHYISIYGKLHSHNQALLRFATLDFNRVQYVHQKELSELSRWWKDLDMESNFPYARDRLPENYLWAVVLYFEPQYAKGRIFMCKVLALISLVDDTFDAYGTFEELKLFNEAIERWDISCLDQLPDYMQLLYDVLLRVFEEIKEEMTKEGALYRYTYAKEAMKYGIRHYFYEAEWRHKKHIPKVDEYMHIAEGSAGSITLLCAAFVAMGDLATKEAFEWVFSKPGIVRALMILGRLKADVIGHEFERKREHIPSAVECFIEEHKVGKKEAVDEFNIKMEATWKDINNAFLKPTQVPVPLLNICLNFGRIMEIFYSKGDWYTHVGPETKALVNQILADPIPE